MRDLLEEYNRLNNSYKQEYIFHVGAVAGFYSEYCNMVSAILYCLKYKYKFILYSQDANFGYKKGWDDFFLPFCSETTFFIHKHYNQRHKRRIRKRHLPIWNLYSLFNKSTLLTYGLWDKYFSKEFDKESFNIPELGIKGNLQEASSMISKMIYHYNTETISEINKYMSSLNLNTEKEQYISMQIRRGDKITECQFAPLESFFDQAIKTTSLRKVFVLTDDYNIIEQIKVKYPEWTIYTLTDPSEKGYNNDEFVNKTKDEKRALLLKLFASIEMIRNSKLFIGTYTTNVGLFLGMDMSNDSIISVQKKNWFRFSDDDVKKELVSNSK